jgi:hypothetical protein
MNRFSWIVCAVLALSASALGSQNCVNKSEFGTQPLILELTSTHATLKFKDAECRLKPVEYNPTSAKYEGWIRVASDKNNCPALSKAMFEGGNSVYWLSISKEVQNRKDGFVQLGYQNTWDPGAGGTAKAFLRCFAEEK